MKKHLAWIAVVLLFTSCKKTDEQPKPRFATIEEAQAHLIESKECEGCNLSKVELSRVNLAGANLKGAILQGCDFTGADLSGANFEDAKMKRCDLSTAANLSGANFSRADLTLANLTGSNTTGTVFCDATMPDGSKSPSCSVANNNLK